MKALSRNHVLPSSSQVWRRGPVSSSEPVLRGPPEEPGPHQPGPEAGPARGHAHQPPLGGMDADQRRPPGNTAALSHEGWLLYPTPPPTPPAPPPQLGSLQVTSSSSSSSSLACHHVCVSSILPSDGRKKPKTLRRRCSQRLYSPIQETKISPPSEARISLLPLAR